MATGCSCTSASPSPCKTANAQSTEGQLAQRLAALRPGPSPAIWFIIGVIVITIGSPVVAASPWARVSVVDASTGTVGSTADVILVITNLPGRDISSNGTSDAESGFSQAILRFRATLMAVMTSASAVPDLFGSERETSPSGRSSNLRPAREGAPRGVSRTTTPRPPTMAAIVVAFAVALVASSAFERTRAVGSTPPVALCAMPGMSNRGREFTLYFFDIAFISGIDIPRNSVTIFGRGMIASGSSTRWIIIILARTVVVDAM
jgi:hypothetical protein